MIFRRFDRVNARNLLILESEIAELEARLDELEKDVAESVDSHILSDWSLLKIQAQDHSDPTTKQRAKDIVEVTLALDLALGKYCMSLAVE